MKVCVRLRTHWRLLCVKNTLDGANPSPMDFLCWRCWFGVMVHAARRKRGLEAARKEESDADRSLERRRSVRNVGMQCCAAGNPWLTFRVVQTIETEQRALIAAQDVRRGVYVLCRFRRVRGTHHCSPFAGLGLRVAESGQFLNFLRRSGRRSMSSRTSLRRQKV